MPCCSDSVQLQATQTPEADISNPLSNISGRFLDSVSVSLLESVSVPDVLLNDIIHYWEAKTISWQLKHHVPPQQLLVFSFGCIIKLSKFCNECYMHFHQSWIWKDTDLAETLKKMTDDENKSYLLSSQNTVSKEVMRVSVHLTVNKITLKLWKDFNDILETCW